MLEQGKMAGVATPAAEQQASVAKWFVLAVAIIVLDQLTKLYFNGNYQYGEQREVIPALLNFTLLYNPGAAFSFLADAGGWQKFFFTGLAFAVSGWLGWQIVQRQFSLLMNWAAAFIIGGALGNVIDRLLHGHVIDGFSTCFDERGGGVAPGLVAEALFRLRLDPEAERGHTVAEQAVAEQAAGE